MGEKEVVAWFQIDTYFQDEIARLSQNNYERWYDTISTVALHERGVNADGLAAYRDIFRHTDRRNRMRPLPAGYRRFFDKLRMTAVFCFVAGGATLALRASHFVRRFGNRRSQSSAPHVARAGKLDVGRWMFCLSGNPPSSIKNAQRLFLRLLARFAATCPLPNCEL